MATPISRRLALAGIGIQSAKGTTRSQPDYSFGLQSGSVFEDELQQARDETTLDNRVSPGANRTGYIPKQTYTVRAYKKMIGALLHLANGTVAVTGPVGSTYTHTFTPADSKPYASLFGKLGSDIIQVTDAQLDSLTIGFDGPGLISAEASFMGCDITFPGSYTPSVSEDHSTGVFQGGGGTFKIDTVSGTPAVANIKSGNVSWSHNVDPIILAKSIKPNDVFPGELQLGVSATIVPTDTTDWRKIVTGASGGTTVSEAVVYGSAEWFFTIDANTDLKITIPRIAFVAKYPDVDPAGGAVEIVCEGVGLKPSGSAAVTSVLRNTVTTYVV